MAKARKPQPILSIIVPVFNEARTIAATLFALKSLRQRGVEIIVVDGGSTDETALLARPLADQVIKSPRGRGQQMNEGTKVANGFIFLFLHPGTKLPDDADTQVMHGRARDTSVWGRFDLRIAGQHALLPLVARFINWRSRMSGLATGDQAIFVQREAFFKIGGFRHIPLLEDVEISQRLKELSPPICVASRVTTSGRRFDEDGLWKTLRDMWVLRFRYRMGADPEELARRYGYSTEPDNPDDPLRSFPRKRESSPFASGSPPSRGRADKG